MNKLTAISVYPEIQDGAPVFSGTRVRIETFYDYVRIGMSVYEFIEEFPSVSLDQAKEVLQLVQQQYSIEQIKTLCPCSKPLYSQVPFSRSQPSQANR